MRRSKEDAARTREAIVSKAAELFRKHGVSSTSVADIMKAVSLTHGGFYRHFGSKEELVSEALKLAFAETVAGVGNAFADRQSREDRLKAFEDYYLSERHVENPEFGCPAAALAGEWAKADDADKAEFSIGVNAMLANLEENLPGDEEERRIEALNVFARQLGAVVLARATNKELAAEILAANRS